MRWYKTLAAYVGCAKTPAHYDHSFTGASTLLIWYRRGWDKTGCMGKMGVGLMRLPIYILSTDHSMPQWCRNFMLLLQQTWSIPVTIHGPVKKDSFPSLTVEVFIAFLLPQLIVWVHGKKTCFNKYCWKTSGYSKSGFLSGATLVEWVVLKICIHKFPCWQSTLFTSTYG